MFSQLQNLSKKSFGVVLKNVNVREIQCVCVFSFKKKSHRNMKQLSSSVVLVGCTDELQNFES